MFAQSLLVTCEVEEESFGRRETSGRDPVALELELDTLAVAGVVEDVGRVHLAGQLLVVVYEQVIVGLAVQNAQRFHGHGEQEEEETLARRHADLDHAVSVVAVVLRVVGRVDEATGQAEDDLGPVLLANVERLDRVTQCVYKAPDS